MKRARDESGFTLMEALVAMVMMLTVLFALYAIFDTGVRVFRFGNDKTEAVENARLGLERMERELRAAHPVNPSSGKDHLFFRADDLSLVFPGEREVTFGNDLNGNGAIGGSAERTTYRLSGSSPPKLLRDDMPVVSAVRPDGLYFAYLDSDGNVVNDEAEIEVVRITLEVSVDGRAQTLTTDVALRNRSG